MPCDFYLLVTEISPDVDDQVSIYLGTPDNIVSIDFENIAISPDDILETRGRTAEIVLAYQEYIVKYLNGEDYPGYFLAREKHAPYQFKRYFNGIFKFCQLVNYQTDDLGHPSYFKVLFTGMLPLDFVEIDRKSQTITLTIVDNLWVWIELAKDFEAHYPGTIGFPTGVIQLWKRVVENPVWYPPYWEVIIHKLSNIEIVTNLSESYYYIQNKIYNTGIINPHGSYINWEHTYGEINNIENNLVNAYRSVINTDVDANILSCVKIKVFHKIDNEFHYYYVIYEAFDCRKDNVINITNVRYGTFYNYSIEHDAVLYYVNNNLLNLKLLPRNTNIVDKDNHCLSFPTEQLIYQIKYLPLYNNYRKIEWNNYYNEWMFSTDVFFTSFPLTEGEHKTSDIVKAILACNNLSIVADRLGWVKIISRNILYSGNTVLGELTDDNIIEMQEAGIYGKKDNMLSSLSIFSGWENAQQCINEFYSELLDSYQHRLKILYDASDTFSPEDIDNSLMKKVIVNNKEYYLLGFSQDILSNKLLELDLLGE